MTRSDDKDASPPPAGPESAAAAPRAVAVALEYDQARDSAPRITATGKGKVAEQILAIAFESGVKVREDADLAQILSVLEVDSVVPAEVLAAVMEILSYVYRANRTLMTQENLR